MRILLTGNRGRIGSVVQRQLDEEGHEVVGYDIADWHDILNSAGVGKAIRDCDGVVHLAMLFGRSIKPENVFANGTLGTWNILQAAELHGVGPSQRTASRSIWANRHAASLRSALGCPPCASGRLR